MIYGHKNQGGFETPPWSGRLHGYYWFIRVEGRDKSKRRRYYRLVAEEKLRLAEMNIDQELIDAVCRYLCNLSVVSGMRMQELVINPKKQLVINFNKNNDILTVDFT